MRREKIWPSAGLFLGGLSFSNPRGSAKWDCMRRDFVNFETRTTFVYIRGYNEEEGKEEKKGEVASLTASILN